MKFSYKIERILRKSHIEIESDQSIPMSKFLVFLEILEGQFEESKERVELLERSLTITSDEIKEYKKSLDQTRTVALQNSKMAAIGEMASNISHEINNPLSIICGSADVITRVIERDHFDEDSKKIALNYINVINKTTHRISKIILGLKRLSNSKMEFQYKKEKIIDVIEESCSMGLENLKILQIGFSLNYDPSLKDFLINIPSVEFSQVIINLFTNAKQALEEWITDEKKTFEINCHIDSGLFKIDFINGGPKIPEEIQDKVFDSFYTTKEVGQGSGVGLSISKKIIEEMKGRLYLDSSYHSPKFCIEIPIDTQNI